MKRLLPLLFAILSIPMTVSAESRGMPYTPDDLLKQSTLVFKGTVLQVQTGQTSKAVFPLKAKVLSVIKGKVYGPELSFRNKSFGDYVIYEQEFNKPQIGQNGTFYLQVLEGALTLIGYIKETEPSSVGDSSTRGAGLGTPKK